ncbi:MAG: hypothetical protein ACOC4A_00985 [Spirochaetota bacterium]
MARRSFKADKRRRQLQKKKKQEQKRQKKQNKDGSEMEGEDQSYLEYLSPGGPMDERYVAEEDENDEDGEDDGEADDSDADRQA